MLARFITASFVMSVLVGWLSPLSVVAQDEGFSCGTEADFLTMCRGFVPSDGQYEGQVEWISFRSEYLPSEAEASASMEEDAEFFATFPKTVVEDSGIDFGDEHIWIHVESENQPDNVFAILKFRIGTVVVDWTAIGESFDALELFSSVYEELSVDELNQIDDPEAEVTRLVPVKDHLPQAFSLQDEVMLNFSEESAGEPTNEELKATIEALERERDEKEKPRPTAAPSSRGSSLEIGDISSKDAGIGDGSIYVYVEVTNNSSRLYSYVGLEGTCYSASGGILGTGMGNAANVAPGENVVVTMIFLSVPGCDNVKVRFDALTGLV